MRRGLKYYLLTDGLIQMIDWWTYLCEIKEDYEGCDIYDEGYWTLEETLNQ